MSTRSRISFNRRRINIRKIINIRNGIILSVFIVLFLLSSTVIGKILLDNKVKSSTVLYSVDNNNQIDIYSEVAQTNDQDNNKVIDENQNDNLNEDTNIDTNSNVSINILGEIMMGGTVTSNLEYSYISAFKDIYTIARASDFTYSNISTNITNLEKIEDAKSKYVVTKQITNGLTALGVDALSIASDHMIDFDKTLFNTTTDILEKNDIFVAGRKDMPVYLEKGNKKIAIISTNSVIIGTSKKYTDVGISVYDKNNMIKNIKEAKDVADVVIVDIHWGREYIYGVTDQMRQIATLAIDNGADMVIGSHAAGVYPIVKYKDKPIIYSVGYLISDSDLNVAKEGFIFNVNIDKDSKIKSLEMTPTYVEDKAYVRLYSQYNLEKCKSYLEQFNNWNIENSLDSKIENNKIIINF